MDETASEEVGSGKGTCPSKLQGAPQPGATHVHSKSGPPGRRRTGDPTRNIIFSGKASGEAPTTHLLGVMAACGVHTVCLVCWLRAGSTQNRDGSDIGRGLEVIYFRLCSSLCSST